VSACVVTRHDFAPSRVRYLQMHTAKAERNQQAHNNKSMNKITRVNSAKKMHPWQNLCSSFFRFYLKNKWPTSAINKKCFSIWPIHQVLKKGQIAYFTGKRISDLWPPMLVPLTISKVSVLALTRKAWTRAMQHSKNLSTRALHKILEE